MLYVSYKHETPAGIYAKLRDSGLLHNLQNIISHGVPSEKSVTTLEGISPENRSIMQLTLMVTLANSGISDPLRAIQMASFISNNGVVPNLNPVEKQHETVARYASRSEKRQRDVKLRRELRSKRQVRQRHPTKLPIQLRT